MGVLAGVPDSEKMIGFYCLLFFSTHLVASYSPGPPFGFWGQIENNGNPLGERFWGREPYTASLGSHDGIQGGIVKKPVSRTFYELV